MRLQRGWQFVQLDIRTHADQICYYDLIMVQQIVACTLYRLTAAHGQGNVFALKPTTLSY